MSRTTKILLAGPIFYFREHGVLAVSLMAAILLLTLLSEVGGLALWISLPAADVLAHRSKGGIRKWLIGAAVMALAYSLLMFFVLPPIARLGGRVRLPLSPSDKFPARPVSILFPAFARNYVRPDVYGSVREVAREFRKNYPGESVVYLDAGFPFWNKFPLLPHFGHSSGRKVDFAYFYQDRVSKRHVAGVPSPIGYWAYEAPRPGEAAPCKKSSKDFRWDFDRLQPYFSGKEIEPVRTRWLINAFADRKDVRGILLEQHLIDRLQLGGGRVRFQGCKYARHDDHFHVGF